MRMAIEMFTTVIVITIAVIFFSSIVSSNNQVTKARDFYNTVVNRIEDSDFSSQVISECESEAEENGYELEVKDVTVYEESPSMLVRLRYSVGFTVFGLFSDDYSEDAVVEGYAR